jgi:N-acetylmuramoyl-L-alanine amidase
VRQISRIVVHHSASARATAVQVIDRWHRDRGFAGIGYHYVIDGDGKLHQGRDLSKLGAHARGFNATSVGVCVTGDNTNPSQQWNEVQCSMLKRVVEALELLFPGALTMGHRDLMNTKCPGLEVKHVLGRL